MSCGSWAHRDPVGSARHGRQQQQKTAGGENRREINLNNVKAVLVRVPHSREVGENVTLQFSRCVFIFICVSISDNPERICVMMCEIN